MTEAKQDWLNIPPEIREGVTQLAVQSLIIDKADRLAGFFVKSYDSVTKSFWYQFFPNPVVEGIINHRLAYLDQSLDNALPRVFDLSSSDASIDKQLVMKRLGAFHLANSLFFHAQALDQQIQDLAALAARRVLLYAANKTESVRKETINREWLNDFISQVQRGEVSAENVIKFVYSPPIMR